MADRANGSDWGVINQELDTTYEEITYTRPIRGFRINARGETNILHKRKEADSNYHTIKAGTGEPFEFWLSNETPSLGWFKAETGTETVEIVVFY